jgi:hypothetical protein
MILWQGGQLLEKISGEKIAGLRVFLFLETVQLLVEVV